MNVQYLSYNQGRGAIFSVANWEGLVKGTFERNGRFFDSGCNNFHAGQGRKACCLEFIYVRREFLRCLVSLASSVPKSFTLANLIKEILSEAGNDEMPRVHDIVISVLLCVVLLGSEGERQGGRLRSYWSKEADYRNVIDTLGVRFLV